jgi:hypothetical protein
MYNLLTDRPFMPEIIDKNNILSFMRSNDQYSQLILNAFNSSNDVYYFHYINVDNLSNTEGAINDYNENTTICNILYEMSTYKDCIFKYADEFVIIDFINHTEQIKNMNDTFDKKATTVIYKCSNVEFEVMLDIAIIKMREVKNTKRGETYAFTYN